MLEHANTPLITDQMLAELAAPGAQAIMGEWDDKTRAFLAVAIPEMATDLLRRRRADLTIAIHPAAAAQSLAVARHIIRAPDPIPPSKLFAACQTLLQHSTFAEERAAATDVLSQLKAAA